jgi:hypothetical protein
MEEIQKGTWAVPPAEGDYTKFEWRYYESNDSLDKVSSFYKSEMPSKGWEETGWMEIQDMHWGMYNRTAKMTQLWSGSAHRTIRL